MKRDRDMKKKSDSTSHVVIPTFDGTRGGTTIVGNGGSHNSGGGADHGVGGKGRNEAPKKEEKK